MDRAFKIIHYNVNPPFTPPMRVPHVFPPWGGKGWGMSALIAMKNCCQNLQKCSLTKNHENNEDAQGYKAYEH